MWLITHWVVKHEQAFSEQSLGWVEMSWVVNENIKDKSLGKMCHTQDFVYQGTYGREAHGALVSTFDKIDPRVQAFRRD